MVSPVPSVSPAPAMRRDDSGFSLAQLIVVMLIFGVVGGGVALFSLRLIAAAAPEDTPVLSPEALKAPAEDANRSAAAAAQAPPADMQPAAVLSPEQFKAASAAGVSADGAAGPALALTVALLVVGGVVLVAVIAVAIVATVRAVWDSQDERSRTRGLERVPYAYVASDGSRFELALAELAAHDWRVYILSQPDYGRRPRGEVSTHRLHDRGGYFVCWTKRLRTARDAYYLGVHWAEGTQRYIATGRFAPPADYDDPTPEPGTPIAELVCA